MSRDIPSTCEIQMYFHCRRCLEERPDGLSPQEWGSMEVGWTALGLQVWCKRHNMNIVHIDFEGHQHPANTGAKENGGHA